MALALSTKAKIAAAALTAATVIGGAFSASAQQMALGGPDMTACDKISLTAPARAAQCRVDAIKAQGVAARQEGATARQESAAADARGSAADVRTACWNEIGDLRRNSAFGDKATEIAREIVKASGRPAAEQDACALRDGVRSGLARMKLIPARVSLN
ncbi:MAG: hypothetical protein ABL904_24250 [Hyphomicrobiaceae bacterium]